MLESEPHLQWYQVVGGVIAIPVTIVTFLYTILLIRKGFLESRKLQLEIKEKEQQLQSPSIATGTNVIQMQEQVQRILLRFIAFILLTVFWSFTILVADALRPVGVIYAKQNPYHMVAIGISLLMAIPKAGLLSLIILYGVPLLRDIYRIIQIKPTYPFGGS